MTESENEDIHDVLTERQLRVMKFIKGEATSSHEIADEFDVSPSTARGYITDIREELGEDAVLTSGDGYLLHKRYNKVEIKTTPNATEFEGDDEPREITDLEIKFMRLLPAEPEEVEEELGIDHKMIEYLADEVTEKGHPVDYDEVTNTYYATDDSHVFDSEHKATKTRKANKWLETELDGYNRRYKALPDIECDLPASEDAEDVVGVIGDLHAGDFILDDDEETQIYNGKILKRYIELITERQIEYAKKYCDDVDVWHEIWLGDMLTNEGIYDGQHLEIEKFLADQHQFMHDPIVARLKKLSEEFDTVNVIAKCGNHGRSNSQSKEANADYVLYKSLREEIASIKKYGDPDAFDNVNYEISSHKNYKEFEMRGGKLKGHVRHGEDRKNGFRTSAEIREWVVTKSERNFDIAYMGHVHTTHRFDFQDGSVIVNGSPKPKGNYAESMACPANNKIACVHGVNDNGITWNRFIDKENIEDYIDFEELN